jgi:hypothetical protein
MKFELENDDITELQSHLVERTTRPPHDDFGYIYALKSNGNVVYLGKACGIVQAFRRINEHKRTGKVFDSYCMARVPIEKLDMAESKLIAKLVPKYNKVFPGEGSLHALIHSVINQLPNEFTTADVIRTARSMRKRDIHPASLFAAINRLNGETEVFRTKRKEGNSKVYEKIWMTSNMTVQGSAARGTPLECWSGDD